jgi:hypothetical protein
MQIQIDEGSLVTFDDNPEYHHLQFRFMITIEETNNLIKVLRTIEDYDAKHTAFRLSQWARAFAPKAIEDQIAMEKINAQAQAQTTEA